MTPQAAAETVFRAATEPADAGRRETKGAARKQCETCGRHFAKLKRRDLAGCNEERFVDYADMLRFIEDEPWYVRERFKGAPAAGPLSAGVRAGECSI